MRIQWKNHPEVIERIRQLRIQGATIKDIARILSIELDREVTYSMTENIINRHPLLKTLVSIDSGIKLYDDYLRLPPDQIYTVVCDLHAPHHSAEWLNRTIMVSDAYKSKTLLIAGDLFEMGFAAHWAQKEGEQKLSLEEERQGIEQVIKWLDFFDKIYLIRGNHESRVTRKTEATIQARNIIKIFTEKIYNEKFIYSYYDKAMIGDEWMAVHPKSYSQISASTAVRLAEKFHRHVLNAHGHFQALRWDRSGRHMGIDLGGLFNKDKIAYINLQTTTHPVWNNGFGILRNNKVHLFGEHTDWTLWEEIAFKDEKGRV